MLRLKVRDSMPELPDHLHLRLNHNHQQLQLHRTQEEIPLH